MSAGCKGVHHHTLPKPFTSELSSGHLYGALHTRSANVLWHFDFLQPSVHDLVHSQRIFLKLFLNCHYFFHGFKYFITLNLLVCAWRGRGTRHTMAQLWRVRGPFVGVSSSTMWILGISGLAANAFTPEPTHQSLNYFRSTKIVQDCEIVC